MNLLQAREYRDEFESLATLVKNARPAAWADDYPSANDLRQLLTDPSIRQNTCVWQDSNGEIVGYALVDAFNNLLFDVLPYVRRNASDAEILAWGVQCMQRRNTQAGTNDTLDAVCRDEDEDRTAWLKRAGFVRQPQETLKFVRPLQAEIPNPVLPEGFCLRAVHGLQEAAALAALHRAAFDSDYLTVERRLAWMEASHYDPALDLVVVAQDGSLAASCFGAIDPEKNARTRQKEGTLDPVATHPHYRRRGLARACLLRGMQLLAGRGIRFAALSTSSENIAMQRTAVAAGFHINSVRVWYSKIV